MSGIPIEQGDNPHAKKHEESWCWDGGYLVDPGNAKAEEKTREKCPHGNNKGKCLICYRIEAGEHS